MSAPDPAHNAESVWVVFADTGGYDEYLDTVWATEAGARQHVQSLEAEGLEACAQEVTLQQFDG